MEKKRFFALLLLLVFAVAMFAVIGCEPADTDTEDETTTPPDGDIEEPTVSRLNMASGWVTGVYYPLAGAMSRIAYLHMDDISLSVESSGASAANCRLIGEGEADLAIVQNDVAFYAVNGMTDNFPAAITNIQGAFMLYPEPVQLIAVAGSGINSPADLAGKKVALGPLGSGAAVNAEQVIAAAGLTLDDLGQVERLEAGEAADYLKDGRIDAAFFTVGIGAAVISELSVTKNILIVEIDDETADALIEEYPYYAKLTIPEGSYTNVAAAQTVAVVSMVVARAELSEDVVYTFIKTIFDNINLVHDAHATGQMVTLDTALDGLPIDLHPGALKFFKEAGML